MVFIHVRRCDIVSLLLATLLNVSVSQGVYPARLKLSKIVPVFKSGDELDANKPISLLSNFNRIFEKFMYSKMISFIEEKGLLYQAQYGFRIKHILHNMQFWILLIQYKLIWINASFRVVSLL